MHANQNSACSNKEEFHYYESQRFYTKLERDAIHQIGWGLTSSLFYFLVTLRTKKLTAFPSKKFLMEYLQAKSHHTLNKYLDELKELGLIRISTLKVIGEDGRARVRWLYSFPSQAMACTDNLFCENREREAGAVFAESQTDK